MLGNTEQCEFVTSVWCNFRFHLQLQQYSLLHFRCHCGWMPSQERCELLLTGSEWLAMGISSFWFFSLDIQLIVRFILLWNSCFMISPYWLPFGKSKWNVQIPSEKWWFFCLFCHFFSPCLPVLIQYLLCSYFSVLATFHRGDNTPNWDLKHPQSSKYQYF